MSFCRHSSCNRYEQILQGKGHLLVPCMLGLDSTWAPSRQITQLGPILRFEFPTKEAEIQALPSLKSEQRTAYRGTSG